jgi:hypothetical protein
LKVVCAWCNSILEYSRIDDGIISHGICMTCAIKFLEEQGIDPTPYFLYSFSRKQPVSIIKAEKDDTSAG